MAEKNGFVDLQPIDYNLLLPKLELTIGQIAKLSGLSVRQISYWTGKGILQATNPKKRIYRAEALTKALLLKQCLDQGMNLTDAVETAELYLAADARPRPAPTPLRAAPVRPAPGDARPAPEPVITARVEALRAVGRDLRARLPLVVDSAEAERIRAMLDVIAFFERNPYARDTASRIAQQIGRAPDLVRDALEALAPHGLCRLDRGAPAPRAFDGARRGVSG